MQVERLTLTGSDLGVTWDDQCAPASAKLVYGSLAQVSTYAVDGAVCGIANPESWSSVPAGDLWFLLIGSDGVGTEGSWGAASDGERNGLASSATCGDTAKELGGTCP